MNLDMKVTESDSPYKGLEKMNIPDILRNINAEDKKVAIAVEKSLLQIQALIEIALKKMRNGGRLFYIGSGTSGRLGIVDASECPPTFGVSRELVIGLIAGGDKAIRNAVEKAEDDFDQGWNDLQKHKVSKKDFVIGISSSGTTPYVVGAVQHCNFNMIETGCITSNPGSPLAFEAKYPIEVIVGPEFVTGSTRMKSGTAQKLVLNMISTTLMIRLGRILDNKMVDMQLNNNKLIDRGARIIMDSLQIDFLKAQELLLEYKSVRKVLENRK
ncbi:MAG: N-acetylmuramic acid 6-phosphate etherase [Bacteroidota bacterium]